MPRETFWASMRWEVGALHRRMIKIAKLSSNQIQKHNFANIYSQQEIQKQTVFAKCWSTWKRVSNSLHTFFLVIPSLIQKVVKHMSLKVNLSATGTKTSSWLAMNINTAQMKQLSWLVLCSLIKQSINAKNFALIMVCVNGLFMEEFKEPRTGNVVYWKRAALWRKIQNPICIIQNRKWSKRHQIQKISVPILTFIKRAKLLLILASH